MTDRETSIRAARVYLAEARNRKHQPGFRAVLLTWAANARRRAAQEPRQGDMFS